MGCVLIEMVTGMPVFRANSNSEQLLEIIKVLGTPTLDDIIRMNPKYDINNCSMPKLPKKDWTKVYLLLLIDFEDK
jgi:glycogen synthase kinase 3 beta